MRFRRLGNTGLLVSEISFGTWLTFAHQLRKDDADRLVGVALDAGINYFDTADMYGKGHAESILGPALSSRAIRQDYVVGTKVFFPMGEGVNNRGLSRKHIFDSIHDSLKRLQLDYVDIYYCHRYDEDTPLVETIQAMQDLIHQGKILHWGVSQWTSDQIAEAASKCKANGWIPPAVNEPVYNLLDRRVEARVLRVCQHHGLGVMTFSPLAQGMLSGKYLDSRPEGSRGAHDRINVFMRDRLSDETAQERVASFVKLADDAGIPPTRLALAFLLRNPAVDSLVVGATSEAQLRDNAAASGYKLSDHLYDDIDDIFPAPTPET